MKSFSPIKLFTPVMFFLVMCLTMISWGAEQTAQQCKTQLIKQCKIDNCSSEIHKQSSTEKNSCYQICSGNEYQECDGLATNEDLKEQKAQCKTEYDKYFESFDDVNNACGALTNVTTKKKSKTFDPKNECSKKIRECHSQAEKASSSNSESPAEQSGAMVDILSDVLGKIGSEPGSGSSAGSCMLDFDNKKLEDAEKEYKTAKKDLQKEINDLNKDIISEKKEMDKTHVEIDKKVNEFNKDHEKDMRSLDKEMRERLKANSDSLVESGKKVRELSKKMLAVQKSVKRINFNFKNTESERASEKIALQCNQAIQTAKKCMLEAYQNKGSAAPAEVCKDVPKVLNRGTKATAEFKKLIQSISDTCYERLNADKANKEYENQQAIENANEEMTELQAQLKDEQSVQQNAQTDLQKIAQESDREKNELATALAKELETLAQEKLKATESATQSVNELNARIAKLKQDLVDLEIQKKTGLKSATKVAESVIGKSKSLYNRAIRSCKCAGKDSPKDTKEMCSTLEYDSNPEQIPEKKAKAGQ